MLGALGDLETDPVDLVTWGRLEADPGEVTQQRRYVSHTLDTDFELLKFKCTYM